MTVRLEDPLSRNDGYLATPAQRLEPMTLQGMVTSPHYLATQAGVDVLRAGGNAVDAAIATVAVLSVVYPQMCTLGGDNFWLVYAARSGRLRALNASGRAGARATIEAYAARGLSAIPARGPLAANTVPGAVSGWEAAYGYARESLGGGLPWARLLQSAIAYAQHGFPVSPNLALWEARAVASTGSEASGLSRFESFARTFLKAGGQAYGVGEVLRQPALADTLRILAAEGAGAFYTGVLAERLVDALAAAGGLLTRDDFVRHTAEWLEPITVPYRGYTACNVPPNTQGFASLEILNILENFDLKALGQDCSGYYHLLVEATKEAFADRDRYLTDPAFATIPLAELLAPEHGREQAARIAARTVVAPGALRDPKGDTVWLGVVDAAGNAVSLIQSIYYDFGSGIVAGDTGVLLQNRGCYFSLDPDHVNRLAPGKRTFHTLNPAMLLREGKPFLVYGTMGGEGQPQTQAALVTRIVDFGMPPQEAVAAPRWLHGRTWGAGANDLKLESRVGEAVIQGLRLRGHPVTVVEPYAQCMGHAGAILIDPRTGVRSGAADPRGDGLAAGY